MRYNKYVRACPEELALLRTYLYQGSYKDTNLPPRDFSVLQQRLCDGKTFKEISATIGVSIERTRQIYRRALRMLFHRTRRPLWDDAFRRRLEQRLEQEGMWKADILAFFRCAEWYKASLADVQRAGFLSSRTVNALQSAGYRTVGDLAERECDLSRVPGIGVASMCELLDFLRVLLSCQLSSNKGWILL